MTRFYWLRHPEKSRYTGSFNARPKWLLPGVRCPNCGVVRTGGLACYPSADLSSLPDEKAFRTPRFETIEEFERIREQVRPLVSPGAELLPGTYLGPMVGTATGNFSELFFSFVEMPVVQREALEQLQAEGVRGLRGVPTTGLRFRTKKNPPELLELEIFPHGRLHPDCTPPRPPPCPLCKRDAFPRPEEPILEAASLPTHTDLFRVGDFDSMIIGTERFVDAVHRLDLDELDPQELPVR
jgi:uncharacterized double-CXXCG motif protein